MAENKPQQNKRENMLRLSEMIKEGKVTSLLGAIRNSNRDLKDIWGMVRKIEQEQAERLRQEDLEYEQQKADSASTEASTDAAAEERVPEEFVVPAEESPVAPMEKTADPVAEERAQAAPAATESVKAETAQEKEKPLTEKPASPAVEKPAAPAPVKTDAQPAAPAAAAVAAKPGNTATARPSFISPNQRPRPVFVPPVRPTLERPARDTRRPMGAPPRPGMAPRPPMSGAPRGPRPGGAGFAPAPDFTAPKTATRQPTGVKKDYTKADDKKSMSKRTLIRKGFVEDAFGGEDRMGSKKLKTKRKTAQVKSEKVTHAVITTNHLTVKMLSEQLGVPAQAILKLLMNMGQMVTINSIVDFESMALVAIDLGVELELKLDQTNEEKLIQSHDETEDDMLKKESRPPIVTVMGHVDHGKTSLLDALRKASVAAGEAGGITQHIGAYSVTLRNRKITFIDTPGHEAFTAMRARGAQVTDVVIIVVAADDGIMPQTVEAINHAKAANVPIVVACNKIDKPAADIERIKTQLTEYGIVPEEWGGDSPVVGVSAKTGQGLDDLLENILFVADIKDLKANPDTMAKGTVIEARLDKGKGPVASIIVQNGTLHIGDTVVSGMTYGHIRAMTDDKGRMVKEAGPSTAVSVLGFQDVPEAGNLMYGVEDEKLAKQVIAERNTKFRNDQIVSTAKVTLDDAFARISEGELKSLNLIVKADVQGSVEALRASLVKISNNEVKVNCIHCAVGAINKSDAMLAETSKAIIIGFNVRADAETKVLAERAGIEIRLYRIIYECLEDVQDAVNGMLAPKFREQVLGHAEVRDVFKITGSGIVAGCYVTDGKIVRNAKLRMLRDNIVVAEGNVDSLKRFKDDVKEVAHGYECGISIENVTDYKIGDVIEAFSLEQI